MTLKYLDTTIAFAVVMLLLSMLVMVLVQAAATLLNLRGRNLIVGLETLLRQAWPALGGSAKPGDKRTWTFAGEIAIQIAKHPAIAAWKGVAQAITKDELLKLLPVVAAANPENAPGTLSPGAAKHLWEFLNGSPEAARKAQQVATQLAGMFPGQETDVSAAVANLARRTGRAEVEVNQWFDTVIARTSDWYKSKTRVITIVLAFLLAFVLHIDTLSIFKQLSTDPELRAKLVQNATNVEESYKKLQDAQGKVATDQLRQSVDDAKKKFEEAQLNLLPQPFPADRFFTWYIEGSHLVGTLLSALFLSLGAPFWFNTLRELSSLRPAVAGKAEQAAAAG